MPRRLRPQVTGLPLHIIQRGNNRQACFFAEEDYQFFLHHLRELSARSRCAVHAYVLMTNHLHLLLTPDLPQGPSLLMKLLGQRYAQYINRTYRRSGALWEGRFRSSIVQTGHYVLASYRYIELNPVRASMVAHPGNYRWSSYAANAEAAGAHWLTAHAEYLGLGSDDEKRRLAYRGLFAGQFDDELLREIGASTHRGGVVGDARFREEIEHALKRRVSRQDSRRRYSPLSPAPAVRTGTGEGLV